MAAQLFFGIACVVLAAALAILYLHFHFSGTYYRGRIEALENVIHLQSESLFKQTASNGLLADKLAVAEAHRDALEGIIEQLKKKSHE